MASESRGSRLADIAEINPRRRVKKGRAVPFIEMAALPLSGRDVDSADVQPRIAKGAGSHFQDGDTLLARITPCLENGKTAQVRGLGKHVVGEGSTEFVVLCGRDPADNDFVYYLCREPAFRQFAIARMEGTSGRQRVAWQSIAEYPFDPPGPSERRASAALLAKIDDRIDNLRVTNATLEAIAQALFKSWFVDFDPVHAKAEGRAPEGMDAATAALFPSEFEDSELGPIPKGWRIMPLLNACDLQGGAQPPASTFVDSPKAGYVRLLQIRDFSSDAHPTYIPNSKKLRTARVDDILIGRYGSASGNKQKDSLGRICRGLEGAYNVALMKLVPCAVGREFALQVFNDRRFYNYLQGVSSKAVQSGFSKKELALYKIVVPSVRVLEHYESIGSAVWEQIKLTRKRVATLAQLRDTLLPRLISGKLRLPEARVIAV